MKPLLAALAISTLTFGYSAFPVSGNIYSLNAGLHVDHSSVRERGMGHSGSSLSDSINYSPNNPASFAAIDYTVLAITFAPEIVSATDELSQSYNYNQDFPLAEMVVPIGSYGVLSASVMRETLQDLDLNYVDKSGIGIRRTASGGTWSGRFGYAKKLSSKFAVGLQVASLHGNTVSGRFVKGSLDTSDLLFPSRIQKNEYSGSLVEGGILWKSAKYSLSLAVTMPTEKASVSEVRQTIQYSSSTQNDSAVTEQKNSGSIEVISPAIRIGTALLATNRVTIALDGEAIFNNEKVEFQVGTGVEIRFSDGRNLFNYFSNIPLRFGLFYHDLALESKVKEGGVAFGFSLPTVGQFGYVNFAVEGSRRFTSDVLAKTYHEDVTRISVQYVHKGRWGRLRRAQSNDLQ